MSFNFNIQGGSKRTLQLSKLIWYYCIPKRKRYRDRLSVILKGNVSSFDSLSPLIHNRSATSVFQENHHGIMYLDMFEQFVFRSSDRWEWPRRKFFLTRWHSLTLSGYMGTFQRCNSRDTPIARPPFSRPDAARLFLLWCYERYGVHVPSFPATQPLKLEQ